MEFRIYYGDGTVYSGDAVWSPAGYKHKGVQCIAWTDPDKSVKTTGRVILHEWDIYIYSTDIGWHGTNKYADLLMHLEDGNVRRVLTGRWVERDQYKAIYKRAKTDPGFDEKSAIDPMYEDGSN